VYVNGGRVSGNTTTGSPGPSGRQALDLSIPVFLAIGTNLVEVLASNGFAEARTSSRFTATPSATPRVGDVHLPDLWVVAIGINASASPVIPPRSYAGTDAEALARALTRSRGVSFREVHQTVLTDTGPRKATQANILETFRSLSGVRAHDVVLVLLVGQDIADDQGEFCFLPLDAQPTEGAVPSLSRVITWQHLKAVFDLQARIILFTDTVHLEPSRDFQGRVVDNDRLVKEMQAINDVALASSRGWERAQEVDQLERGAFAHALLQGLASKADLNMDQTVTVEELGNYVLEAVPRLTNGDQSPITSIPEGYLYVPLAVVK
jgi:hypothetical protein